jgi:exodeoxyribonuclease V alpha subunit
MKTEIAWLKKAWQMPESAVPAVEALIAAHAAGSTALRMDAPVADWGAAAAAPDTTSATPLLVAEHDGATFLQTRWLFEAEKSIAIRLKHFAKKEEEPAPPADLERYFAESGAQRDAAGRALSRGLSIITGGPGTGKTYTLARILALLLERGDEAIQLAAPTGKAADRMKEAVLAACHGMDNSLTEKLHAAAATSRTIHSLLGFHPGKNACTFNARRRLPCAVLIVDECSMVDTLLWRALLEALPDDCKLILLGDPNQLESVGRGSVFTVIASAPSLQVARTHLAKSHRFADRPGIAALAAAIENQDAGMVMEVLEGNTDPECPHGVFWHNTTSLREVFANLPAPAARALQAAASAPSPQEALTALESIRILSAHRPAPSSHRLIEELIAAQLNGLPVINRPVIIDRNDHETGLRNGEVGVIHLAETTRRACFDKRGPVPLFKLPEHSPAWIITIHRSQGSEFDHVVVLLPANAGSPLATRELLYTALTRAKRTVSLFGPHEVIAAAVRSPGSRQTLLDYHIS